MPIFSITAKMSVFAFMLVSILMSAFSFRSFTRNGYRSSIFQNCNSGSRHCLEASPSPSIVSNLTPDVDNADHPAKKLSFVQDVMRPYAMKLHTRDQAPIEGQQKAQTPVSKWVPSRSDYLHFLVDSLAVYEALDEIVAKYPALAAFQHTGLERSAALKEDIQWMASYDKELTIPECGLNGKLYSEFLKAMAAESIPKFACHYYNQYFAHTAGGLMIGKRMSDQLLGGATLKFYQWEGDVKQLLEATRNKIDELASSWTEEEQRQCLEETIACFKYGGSLMVYMRPPSAEGH